MFQYDEYFICVISGRHNILIPAAESRFTQRPQHVSGATVDITAPEYEKAHSEWVHICI